MEIIEDLIEEAVVVLITDIGTYPFPGLWGWLSIGGLVTSYTIWAKRTKHTTMSGTLWYYKDFKKHPCLAPIIILGWSYLTYHLLVEDYIKSHRKLHLV